MVLLTDYEEITSLHRRKKRWLNPSYFCPNGKDLSKESREEDSSWKGRALERRTWGHYQCPNSRIRRHTTIHQSALYYWMAKTRSLASTDGRSGLPLIVCLKVIITTVRINTTVRSTRVKTWGMVRPISLSVSLSLSRASQPQSFLCR